MRSITLFLFCIISLNATSWGFQAHRSINFHAVFLLPKPLFSYFRPFIHDLRDFATKADQRRYIMPSEGPRHFIDLDHYEQSVPLDTVIKNYDSAILYYSLDSMLQHGILPWNLRFCFFSLVKAFKEKDTILVIKKAADLGHYIADAHVPLHTTANYNGQLTKQNGIHGLWESRLPELFMHSYPKYGRRATTIRNIDSVIWTSIEESYGYKDEVLLKEKLLDSLFHGLKHSFETKNKTVIKVYSKEYAEAYHTVLESMVEERLLASIQRLADLWYTAFYIATYKKEKSMLLQPTWSNNMDSSAIKRALLH